MREPSSCLLLSVSADRTRGHLFASLLLHHWLQFAVEDGLMRTILPANGCNNVTLDLLCCETAWSSGSLLMLQRRSRAIPASKPILDRSASTAYSVAMRECSEVVSTGAWRVLKEDLMFLLWSELFHAALTATEATAVRQRRRVLCIEISVTQASSELMHDTGRELKTIKPMYEQSWTMATHAMQIMSFAFVPAMQASAADYENNFGQCCRIFYSLFGSSGSSRSQKGTIG